MIELDVDSISNEDAEELIGKLAAKLGKMLISKPHRSTRAYYKSMDWSKSNYTLAAETGIGYGSITQWRRKLNKPRVCGGKLWPLIQIMDWSKSNADLAREHKVDLVQIAAWRKRLRKPPGPPDRELMYEGVPPAIHGFDFTGVDWVMSDTEISRQLGCSREYVRQKRASFDIPKSLSYGRKYDAFRQAFTGMETISHRKAKEIFPKISHSTFSRYCAKAGLRIIIDGHRRGSKYPRHLMNWQLPNIILQQFWQLPVNFCANWRSRHPSEYPSPSFYSKHGSVPTEWEAAVKEEWAKAQAWLAENGAAAAGVALKPE